MKKNWNIFLVAIFAIISFAILTAGTFYKTSKSHTYEHNQYNKIANSLINKFQTLIDEKKNATLTIGLSLAQSINFQFASHDQKRLQQQLQKFSNQLRTETDFKNVWIQFINNDGVVVSRSWTNKRGDKIYDTKSMGNLKEIKTIVSVDKYDLSFKASIPLLDESGKNIGVLETITHFNSIAKKIKEEGFDALVLVDKRFKKQLKYPFTGNFINDNYLANKDIDKELLTYIKSLDIDKELDYKTNYTIDFKAQYFKVNYTIFDSDNKPMAYALMYKKIKYIDTGLIRSNNYIINLFMVFTIIIVVFLLLLLADKDKNSFEDSSNIMKSFLIFILVFMLISFTYILLLSWYQNSEKKSYLKNYNNDIEKDYQIIQKKFEAVSESMFETTLKDKRVIALIKDAYTEKKDQVREELYNLLKDRYEYFKNHGIRQLHFHLKDNESFLRFHRPKRHGDSLTGVRPTVEYVNSTHNSISGFEEGRIYSGFRYVFPLSYYNNGEKEHLGSVEVSFSAHAFVHEFAHIHDMRVGFIINKSVVDAKVFDSEHGNYEQSHFSGFYYEKSIKKQFEHGFRHFNVEHISNETLPLINTQILKGEVFSIVSRDNNSLLTFFPLKNSLSNEIVASIIIETNNEVLRKQDELFIVLLSVGLILILLIIVFVFREYSLKIKFFDLSMKTQHILDLQSSIVIITNSRNIFDVNKKFLDFFGYANLENFKDNYDCICEHFIEDESYYHLGKVPESTTWVDYLEEIPHKDRIVLIKDRNQIEHSFAVTFSHYKHEYYVVTFTDVSGTMQEQFILEKKVSQDLLTGAYNREFFDKNIAEITRDIKMKGRSLGLIFFDIDHFKEVNDTYGHNVGDHVLQALSRIVMDSIRESDYLIRWGGEEFIVLVSTSSLGEATRVAEHLRSRIEHYTFESVEKITCSFGVTLHTVDEKIIDTIQRVDGAMYKSKNEGRNRVTTL